MKTVVEWFAWSVVGLLGFGLIVLGWAWLLEGLNRRRELALETSRKLGARGARLYVEALRTTR